MKLLIKNIKTLVQVEGKARKMVSGKDMGILDCIHNAWLTCENDIITGFGSMKDWPGVTDWSDLTVIDAENKLVFPSWCDSHTHVVFAGSREQEFADRIKGLSYEDIAKRGGGINNSAKRLQEASEEELLKSALQRIQEMISQGTGAAEIKSGYGLTLENELKMLRVIKKLKTLVPISLKATFLGAHAIPEKYKNKREDYIRIVTEEMIPAVAEEKLADYCDVFCEKGYFTKEETLNILEKGKQYGLKPKVHAEQLSNSGGVYAGVMCGAISVDHLEYLNDKEIELLKDSGTMPTILPGAAFFLNLPHPPARKIIEAGLPLAIASDFNPGSSPTGNMNLMISIACIQYKLTPEEAIHAATINSAYAMDLSATHGSIAIGKKANFFITKEIPGYSTIPYSFGSNLVETVVLNGKMEARSQK